MESANMNNKQVKPNHFWSLTKQNKCCTTRWCWIVHVSNVDVWNNRISEVFLNHYHIWQQLSVSRTAVLREKSIVVSHFTLSSTCSFT